MNIIVKPMRVLQSTQNLKHTLFIDFFLQLALDLSNKGSTIYRYYHISYNFLKTFLNRKWSTFRDILEISTQTVMFLSRFNILLARKSYANFIVFVI